jgi:hypothetical protein
LSSEFGGMSGANHGGRSVEQASAALLAMLARPPVHERVRRTIAGALKSEGGASRHIDARLHDLLDEISDPPSSREDLFAIARIAAFAADRAQLFTEAAARLVAAVLDRKEDFR